MLVLNVLSGSNTHYIFLRSLSLNRVQLMGVARSKDRPSYRRYLEEALLDVYET